MERSCVRNESYVYHACRLRAKTARAEARGSLASERWMYTTYGAFSGSCLHCRAHPRALNSDRLEAGPTRVLGWVLIIGLSLGGCDKAGQNAGPPPDGPPEVAVVVMHPERVVITTELPGRTAAFLVADVRPQVGGILQERLFTEGGDVKKCDVLYQIDSALYQATYDNAVAALAKAEANLPPIQLKVDRYKEAVDAKAVSRHRATRKGEDRTGDVMAAEVIVSNLHEAGQPPPPRSGRV